MNRLPNLLIVGVPKAGTTSLFEYLGQHPDVFPSPVKETRFFKGPSGPDALAAYSTLFRRAGRQPYVLEATPVYFAYGLEVAARIDEALPDARVIVSLREPVARLRSHHAMLVRAGRLDPAEQRFEAFVRPLLAGESDRGRRLDWLDRSNRYGPLVHVWAETFGDRLRIVFFDDLVSDPRSLARGLCEWLGLASQPCDGFDYSVRNRRARYRSASAARTARRVARAAGPLLSQNPRIKGVLRGLHGRVNSRPWPDDDEPSEATLQALHERYANSNQDLTRWLHTAGYSVIPEWLTHAKIGP